MELNFFKLSEFDCNETGENEMDPVFLKSLDLLRARCGFPFHIVSGYRSPNHSIEKAKPGGPGQHAKGLAADIRVNNGKERYTLVNNALAMGFTGIGVDHTYIHVDKRKAEPVLWTY